MLNLLDSQPARDCQGFSRREFLRVGSLALGGLTLPGLLAARAQARALDGYVADKSVVFLYLQGGPSHIELFDPKMTAPEEIRSITGEVPTSLPGVTFGGTFPQMAAIAHRLAVVRSFASGNADHQNLLAVAGASNRYKAPMGTIYARLAGTNHPRTGVPRSVFVPPEGAVPGLKLGANFETKALPQLATSGTFQPGYAAFDPSGGGELKANLDLRIPREQFEDRRNLLSRIDGLRRQMEATRAFEAMDDFQQQAFDVIVRGVSEAFDLANEDPRTVARYDTSPIFDQAEFQRWGDMRRCSNLLGKQMLLARRLCEAGCGFVTVSDSGWDMHSNGNSPKNLEGMQPLGRQVDHAVAAFVEDIHERGLEDKILLVISGEMGRTPKINKNGGRDHYANLTPLCFAGGGLKMGQVIGASDETASVPATDKYTPEHLVGTVMHTLFDVGRLRLETGLPSDVVKMVTESKTIRELTA
jgi:uncharacterized protein (DUF1501 family)